MSQPKTYGPNESDPLDRPIANFDDLLQIFHDAERPKSQQLIGLEYEMFGQTKNGPLPYEGPVSITSLFQLVAQQSKSSAEPYEIVAEGSNIVALNSRRGVIALEPGGQIEIALKPYRDLDVATSDFANVIRDIEHAGNQLGINFFALGIHPSAQKNEMATVKKARYGIMRSYMEKRGTHGLDMMTRSCAIQLNLDYANERDMASKTKLAALLVPFYSLLCASCAFVDKKPSPYAIMRGHVWRTTDPDRTGIPKTIFDADFGYASWINLVMSVPMYFIRRGSVYHDVAGCSFRDYMRDGLHGYTATVRDFVDHMSTVFTEIRLKPILELRSADSLPIPYCNALTALTWTLFYDDHAHERAHEVFDGIRYDEIVALHNDVIDHGRHASLRGRNVYDIAADLLDIAGNLEMLKPLSNLVEQSTTCAEWIAQRYQTLDDKSQKSLIADFNPFNDPIS